MSEAAANCCAGFAWTIVFLSLGLLGGMVRVCFLSQETVKPLSGCTSSFPPAVSAVPMAPLLTSTWCGQCLEFGLSNRCAVVAHWGLICIALHLPDGGTSFPMLFTTCLSPVSIKDFGAFVNHCPFLQSQPDQILQAQIGWVCGVCSGVFSNPLLIMYVACVLSLKALQLRPHFPNPSRAGSTFNVLSFSPATLS